MRKRNNISTQTSLIEDPHHSESDPEETAIQPSHPVDDFTLDSDAAAPSSRSLPLHFHAASLASHLKQGKIWWVKILTISIAAVFTYSYNNVGNHSTNVQIAIMTVITVVGATPFCSTHLIPAAIGAFAGGHNIIGSTGLIDNANEIHYSNFGWLLLLSFAVGMVWCFIVANPRWNILDGYAGRLGTTTFIGMNLVMLTIFCPLGVVDWDRYYYGMVQVIHIAEEDATLPLASAWEWTEEAELAIGYVLAVLWMGIIGGGTRIFHQKYIIQQCESVDKGSGAGKQPPTPLNNVLVPVLWTMLSIFAVNVTQYKHGAGLFNGFAVGAYVAMASLQKITSIGKFAVVSLLAAGWGLALTPFFVGFAGKSGFTSMMGHVTHEILLNLLNRIRLLLKLRQQEQEMQQQQLVQQRLELKQQQQSFSPTSSDSNVGKEDPETANALGQDNEADVELPNEHWPRIDQKPKKEKFVTKYQRRQQQRLKHLQQHEEDEGSQILHHRAWVALPADGDGIWQHSLEQNAEKHEQDMA